MPVPRRGFNRAREIGTESSNGSFAVLFMAFWRRLGAKMLGFHIDRALMVTHVAMPNQLESGCAKKARKGQSRRRCSQEMCRRV
jgi:hypothetical protein